MQEKRSDHLLEHQLLASGATASDLPVGSERRATMRIKQQFPVRIWGVDSGDLPFNLDCVVENISSSGVLVHMARTMRTGSDVRMIVHLETPSRRGATVALFGSVVRSEQLDDGHGVAVEIARHKIL